MSQHREKTITLTEFAFAGLAAIMGLGCFPGFESGGPAAPPDHVQWLKGAAKPFSTVDPAANDNDLAILEPMIGNAALVGLGEATHGSSECFRMKHRLLRHLVERQGFTAFGLEADLALCRALDEHVLTGAGDPRALVQALVMWPWATEEVVDLVAWMRAYNADPAHARKVRFFGFDMQDGEAAIERLTTYLGAVDPNSTLALILQVYRPFTGLRNPARLPYSAAPQHLRSLCRSGLLDGQRWMVQQREAYTEVSGIEAYEWALRMAELLIQHETFASSAEYPRTLMAENFRDRFMADNAEWAIQQLGLGTRAVLWAHNGHVNKKGAIDAIWTNTGDWLAQRLGARYLSIGFAFGAGSFNAIPADSNGGFGTLQPFPLPPAENGSYESAFLEAGLAHAFLDLRQLDLTHPGALWFSQARSFREIGSTFNPGAYTAFTTNLVERFDLLVFLRNVSASKLLGQGFMASAGPARASLDAWAWPPTLVPPPVPYSQ